MRSTVPDVPRVSTERAVMRGAGDGVETRIPLGPNVVDPGPSGSIFAIHAIPTAAKTARTAARVASSQGHRRDRRSLKPLSANGGAGGRTSVSIPETVA